MKAGLPDVPRWVEAHGIAADPEHWEVPLGADGGFALGHDAEHVIVVGGDADPLELRDLAARHRGHAIVVTDEALAHATGRTPERVIVHTLRDPDALPDYEGAAPLQATDLESVPAELADELRTALAHGTVWAVWLDGAPVSFAYAPCRSEKYFDISVDTLPGARQLGLGTIVAAAMIRDERAHGREPVWAADEGNAASIRLARRLGFEPTDEIWVCAH